MKPCPPTGLDTQLSGSVIGTDPGQQRVILVLAHRPDPTAERLVALLRRMTDCASTVPITPKQGSPHPCENHSWRSARPALPQLVFLDEIATSPSFRHGLDGGRCQTSVRLRDGRSWSDTDLAVVVNRLQFADVPQFSRARAVDREYAVMEFFALLISWLSGLDCPVIQPPSAQALHGRLLSPIAWQSLAVRAGLAVPRLRVVTSPRLFPAAQHPKQPMVPIPHGPDLLGIDLPDLDRDLGADQPLFLGDSFGTDHQTVLVFGEEILGDLPGDLAIPCRRLVRLSGHTLLRIHFSRHCDGDEWLFTGAEPVPNLATSSEIAALARLIVRTQFNTPHTL